MRLLLDAHISGPKVATALRKAGHDVRAADEERSLDGLTDEELLGLATRERRILVTFDVKDFPGILRRRAEAGQSHAGCALVVGLDPGEFGALLKLLAGAFAVRPGEEDWRDRACFVSRAPAD